MAKNDQILLDGIIDDRIEQVFPSRDRGEVFEYLAIEQVLKDFDLSRDEIESGIVDGRNDGGIDGFFIFVNGILLSDTSSFFWPRIGSELDVWIITCKHQGSFVQAPLDNFIASLSELLDLSIETSHLMGDYSDQVIKRREDLKFAYRKLATKISKFSVHFAYCSRGDTSDLGDSVVSRSKQIQAIAKDSFGQCESSFTFYGCKELIQLHRRAPEFSLELPYVQILSKGERYVLLAKLIDYYRFVTDNGKLRRYLFDSNVRDFMGLNSVNEDIKATLEDENSPDFWWLNNGITILTTNATIIGNLIKLENIQIVNGLQTTQSIYKYFHEGGNDPNDRAVLIKVVVSDIDATRDAIIRATNNQTAVEGASLRATDKIQKDIEDILERNGIYYERRKNYYKNIGQRPRDIITPLYLAAGYISLILKNPHKAAGLKSRFMRNNSEYNKVFSIKTPIILWPVIAKLLKRTDEALEKLRPSGSKNTEKYLSRWRHITGFLTVSRLMTKFDFSEKELIGMDISTYTNDEVFKTWDAIRTLALDKTDTNILGTNLWKRKEFLIDMCRLFSEELGVTGIERVARAKEFPRNERRRSVEVDMDFALRVNDLLPPQPWKPGMHHNIIKEMNCSGGEYFTAVELLIKNGIRYQQRDGVVYDGAGNVLSIDTERVDPTTLKLLGES